MAINLEDKKAIRIGQPESLVVPLEVDLFGRDFERLNGREASNGGRTGRVLVYLDVAKLAVDVHDKLLVAFLGEDCDFATYSHTVHVGGSNQTVHDAIFESRSVLVVDFEDIDSQFCSRVCVVGEQGEAVNLAIQLQTTAFVSVLLLMCKLVVRIRKPVARIRGQG